jgi:hypothetical protein
MIPGNKTATTVHGGTGQTNTQHAAQRPPGTSRSNRQVMTTTEEVMRPARIVDTTGVDEELSTRRLNFMRFGYAFMGVGLAIVKWPILVQDARSLPVMEGVVTCLLTAMGLLAFLGLRYPVRMLSILLLDVAWKAIWLAAVAIPRLVTDEMNAATSEVLFNCSFVIILLAVIPWRHVVNQYVVARGERWR